MLRYCQPPFKINQKIENTHQFAVGVCPPSSFPWLFAGLHLTSGVTHRVNSPPPGSMECFSIFQLTVLDLCSTALLLCFILSTGVFSSSDKPHSEYGGAFGVFFSDFDGDQRVKIALILIKRIESRLPIHTVYLLYVLISKCLQTVVQYINI